MVINAIKLHDLVGMGKKHNCHLKRETLHQ